jgi:hypothetical protein
MLSSMLSSIIRSCAECAREVFTLSLSVSFLLCVLCAMTSGQAPPSNPSGSPGELYGGIELSNEGVKVIALQVSQTQTDEEPGLRGIYSEMIRLRLGRTSDGEFPLQASADAAQAVSTALTRLRQQYKVPLDRIYFIGASGLGADHPDDLESVIRNATGLTLKFLDAVTEVQLSIAGTISRTAKVDGASIDNRNTSMMLHIGNANTQIGCEILKYSASDSPTFDFVAMNLPQGVVSYANEISKATGRSSTLFTFTRQVKTSGAQAFRQALRREMENKPTLMHRKRVFLTGNLVWAVATLLYPEDRQPMVSLTFNDIMQFSEKMARDPRELALRRLNFIRDKRLRTEVEQEFEAVRATFKPEELIAGAEMLKAAAEELKWQDKKIIFARRGHLGCILSYTRLFTGK